MRLLMISLVFFVTTLNADQLSDPTRPIAYEYVLAEEIAAQDINIDFVLQAVYISPKGRSALVNGQRYQLGDVLAGKTIVHIEDRSLELVSSEGERSELKMYIPTIKSRTNLVKGGSL